MAFVIFRWKRAGTPVARRGMILPVSVTYRLSNSGFFQSIASSAVSTRRRGIVRFALRKLERRCGVLGWFMLLDFAVKRAALQVRIVFLFLEPVRCVQALLVACRDVTRNGFPLRLGLGALDDDEVS